MFMLMVLLSLVEGGVEPNRAAICLSAARLRLGQEGEYVMKSLQTPGITYDDVFGKLITSAALFCYHHIQFSDFFLAINPKNAQTLPPRMRELTPIPEEILCGLEDIELSQGEKDEFMQLVDAIKTEYQRTDNRGKQQI